MKFHPIRPAHLLTALFCSIVFGFPPGALSQEVKSEWKFQSQRPALFPAYSMDSKTTFNGNPTLTIKGGGKAHAAGHWYKVVKADAGAY
ncbi:MAG: hypothetical protein ABIR06_12880, partial [Cyclobacteriaceae bacterium]